MRKIKGLTKITATIPLDTKEWLKEIGSGNLSKSLRILHQRGKNIDYPVGRPKKTTTNTT